MGLYTKYNEMELIDNEIKRVIQEDVFKKNAYDDIELEDKSVNKKERKRTIKNIKENSKNNKDFSRKLKVNNLYNKLYNKLLYYIVENKDLFKNYYNRFINDINVMLKKINDKKGKGKFNIKVENIGEEYLTGETQKKINKWEDIYELLPKQNLKIYVYKSEEYDFVLEVNVNETRKEKYYFYK